MTAVSEPKRKFNSKLKVIPIILIVVVAVVVSWQVYGPSSNAPNAKVALTLIGANGRQKNLTLNELISLDSYSSFGGYINDNINDENMSTYGNYTGCAYFDSFELNRRYLKQ